MLIGEVPGTPASLFIKDRLIKEAGTDGKIFFAHEGWYANDLREEALLKEMNKKLIKAKNPKVYGVEDQFVQGLIIAVKSYIELIVPAKNGSQAESGADATQLRLLLDIARNPFLQEALSQTKLTLQGPGVSELLAILADAPKIYTSTNQLDEEQVAVIQASEAWRNRSIFLTVAKKLAESYLELAGTKNLSAQSFPFDLGIAKTVVEKPNTSEFRRRFYTELAINWRNHSVAHNVAALYCKANKEHKDLTIMMGEAHLPGLSELLRKMSLGSYIEIESQKAVNLSVSEFFDSQKKLEDAGLNLESFTNFSTYSPQLQAKVRGQLEALLQSGRF